MNRKRISWLLEWTISKSLEIRDLVGFPSDLILDGNVLQMRSEAGLRQRKLWSYELAYRFNQVGFKLRPNFSRETKFDLETDNTKIRFVRNPGRAWPLSSPVNAYLFPNEMRRFYQNADFLGDFELGYEELMDSIYYLGPLRDYPQREYHWGGVKSRRCRPARRANDGRDPRCNPRRRNEKPRVQNAKKAIPSDDCPLVEGAGPHPRVPS